MNASGDSNGMNPGYDHSSWLLYMAGNAIATLRSVTFKAPRRTGGTNRLQC